jgi:hypothetical protein
MGREFSSSIFDTLKSRGHYYATPGPNAECVDTTEASRKKRTIIFTPSIIHEAAIPPDSLLE